MGVIFFMQPVGIARPTYVESSISFNQVILTDVLSKLLTHPTVVHSAGFVMLSLVVSNSVGSSKTISTKFELLDMLTEFRTVFSLMLVLVILVLTSIVQMVFALGHTACRL
uniref:Uncharacterized protein n=1 Tax=uncultured marine thaumarchaeote KM3_88_B06 TaxID=1456332 RepID=A0A075I1R4_9ARCH|nr:hypothetical protein [uncultured marine thaumarchaeote KM3_88_B06]